MKFIRGFRKFKLIKENLSETKSFFEKNKEVILSYYKFIFDNCGNATAIEEFKSKWSQLLDFIKKDYPSSFNEFKNWISNETKTRLKLSLKLSLANWQKQNKESLDIINEFETMLGFSLSGEKIQNLSTDNNLDENCFDNETLGVVQLLPHNFKRSGKDVICKEKPEFDPNKKSILLVPGGDGKPAVDFEHIAKKLTDYNLFSFNYSQDKLQPKDSLGPLSDYIEKYSIQVAEDANEKIPNELSVVGFSLGTTIGYFAHKAFTKFNNKFVCIDAGLPPESTGDPSDPEVFSKDLKIQIINMMVQNPPQKYNCMRKSKIEESEQRSVGPEHVTEFRYEYKEEFDIDKIEDELRSGKLVPLGDSIDGKGPFSKKGYTVDDFEFKLQDTYEEFKKNKKLLYEYVDDPKDDDRSHTYVDNKPSSAYTNGKKISLEDAKKLEKTLTDDDIWIVRDKWEGSSDDEKEFWFEQSFRNLYLWVVEHKGITGKAIPKGENFGNVQVLYLKAGGTTKKITIEEVEEELEKRPLSKNTKIDIIPNCVHGDMLEDSTSSNIIASKIIAFLK